MNSDHDGYRARSPIQVLTVNFTGVVAETVQQTIHQQLDIQLIGNLEALENINSVIAETDILVLGVEDIYSLPERCLQLLTHYPNLKILLMSSTRDTAIAYWKALHCHSMQITSSQNLVESLRQVYTLSSSL